MKFYLGSKVPINTPSAFSALNFFNDLEITENGGNGKDFRKHRLTMNEFTTSALGSALY